jgi:hypothetical protein
MKCCAGCFGDRGLRKDLIPARSFKLGIEIGRCSYCESENVAILAPAQLAEYFELLISAYRPDSKGKLLIQWFREDWGMFEHPRMDDPRAKDLLSEILDDGEIVRQTFLPSDALEADRLGQWERLRDELMYHNRFFPDVDIDLDRLKELLNHLKLNADEIPDLWHRARIQIGDTAFSVGDMGAPPRRIASHGRANPAGIPYLYLGSTQATAISEIRPHTGEIACVADFRTPLDLKLVDLRRPRKMVSPFLLADAEDIGRMRNDLPFLERLGEELTMPVLPQAAAIDYTPSQYLCEFIKKCAYDGVIYRSSVSDGINLALFDPSRAQSGAVTQYRVARVSVDMTAVNV